MIDYVNIESSQILSGLTLCFSAAALAIAFVPVIKGLFNRKAQKRELEITSFYRLIDHLKSSDPEAQLSAAILLRSFLNVHRRGLHNDTIKLISSLLRRYPTGILQKTLSDGLGYAINLNRIDLTGSNLQNTYLGNKKHTIYLNETDFYCADLSSANITKAKGNKVIFFVVY